MWTTEDEFQLMAWYVQSYKSSMHTMFNINISVLSTNPFLLSRANPSLTHLFPLPNNPSHLHRNRLEQALSHFAIFASFSFDQHLILVHQKHGILIMAPQRGQHVNLCIVLQRKTERKAVVYGEKRKVLWLSC